MSYTRDEPLLCVRDVYKSYGSKEVLSGVNFTLRDLHSSEPGVFGQVFCILGPSGCGKSVLTRIIAGLEQSTTGAVMLDNSEQAIAAGDVGVVFQGYVVRHNRTVLSNLVLAGKLSGMSSKEATEAARRYLDEFDLKGQEGVYPCELSGGMRQRLAMIRALLKFDGPKAPAIRIMMMDEPFSALDPERTRKACQLIRRIADKSDKNTVGVVTHDMRAALSVADMLYVLGRECRPDGTRSGGKIVKEIDLAESGFAWHPDSHASKEFVEAEAQLSSMFGSL